jgi:Flp pilus assembly pilin Flp
MFLRKRKAQGILEYTLLLGAIIAIVVVVVMGKGGVASKVSGAYSGAGNAVNATAKDATTGVFQGAQQ